MALEQRRGFKPDHESFGRFLMSEQALEPVKKAARDVADIARDLEDAQPGKDLDKRREGAERYAGNFKVQEHTPVVIGGNMRRVMHVFNDKRYAAAREFGRKRKGGTRSLRRAGAQVGQLRGEIG